MGRNLTGKQIRAIELLTEDGLTVTQAAVELRVDRNTVDRWVNGNGYAAFKRAYNERIGSAMETGRQRLRLKIGAYLTQLDEIAVGPMEREDVAVASVRLRAIEAALNRAGLPAATRQEMNIEDARREIDRLVERAASDR